MSDTNLAPTPEPTPAPVLPVEQQKNALYPDADAQQEIANNAVGMNTPAPKPADPAPAPAPAAEAKPEPTGNPLTDGEGGKQVNPLTGDEVKPEPAAAAAPEGDAIDPASYEITLPEGVTADEDTLNAFRTEAAALRLPPEGAQKLADIGMSLLQKQQTAALESFNSQIEAWKSEVRALPEFQGDLSQQSWNTLARMMDEHGSPELRAMLNATGAGHSPHLVKFVLSMAKLTSEPAPLDVHGRPVLNGGKKPTNVELVYPNLAPQ